MDVQDLIFYSAGVTDRTPTAAAISVLRAADGLSQSKLAERADVSASVVSTAERTGRLSEESLVSIASGLSPRFGQILLDVVVKSMDLGDVPGAMEAQVRQVVLENYSYLTSQRRARLEAANAPKSEIVHDDAGEGAEGAKSVGGEE